MTITDLINNGYYTLYSGYRMYQWLSYCIKVNPCDNIIKLYDYYCCFSDCLDKLHEELSLEDINTLVKLFNNRSAKVYRLKKRLAKMFANDCIFLTLTFRDSVLDSTSSQTRRDYVRKFLKSLGASSYVANIDFGINDEYTKREHYHSVVEISHIDLNLWPYGVSHVEKIRCDNVSGAKLSHYINKITNHAYKDSTKKLCSLIYSRKRR